MNSTDGILFSLIVPTLNRHDDVERLLVSIAGQSCRDFEVIIVDQNADDRLGDLCREFARRMPLLHLKVESKGAARARNHGLGFAKGGIINFPDDDCQLTPGLLETVAALLKQNPDWDAVFGRAIDPVSKESSVTKFDSRAQWVTPGNVYQTTVEFTMFARRSLFDEVGLLDENLGVGTFFGAEEGADFVLRALYRKKRLFYDPSLLFYHVEKVVRYDEKDHVRAYEYGKGFGRLSVKHARLYRQPRAALRFLYRLVRAAMAVALYLCVLKPNQSKYYRELIRGRMVGVFRSWSEFGRNGAATLQKKC